MNLADVFTAVAYKELTQVDLPSGSHQHEINGSETLKKFFGTSEAVTGHIKWHYFADNQESVQDEGDYTFYDARAKGAMRTHRSEWRLYYTGNFLQCADPGDILIISRIKGQEDIYGLIFQANSSWLRAASMLLELKNTTSQLKLISTHDLNEHELESIASLILIELGIDFALPARRTDEELVAQKFGMTFPKTIELSRLAREEIEVSLSDPDETLLKWLQREEELFRALERTVVQVKLDKGFESVDDFIKYSLSVQNRRKSRMGYALQNHIQALLDACEIRYTPQAQTEGKNKPDILFPSKRAYHNPDFNSNYLTMLALKATAKDRWRQILTEANRIPNKHLCTLEPGISTDQTNEMKQQKVTLVIPHRLLEGTYTEAQRKEALSVSDFLSLIRLKQEYLDNH